MNLIKIPLTKFVCDICNCFKLNTLQQHIYINIYDNSNIIECSIIAMISDYDCIEYQATGMMPESIYLNGTAEL